MKKIAHILVFSLLLWGFGCQETSNTQEGYGASESGLQDDRQTGGGQVDDSERGAESSNNGGTMNNAITGDSMHNPGAVGETDAASAAEKTQQRVGNSNTRGEANTSQSRTTVNKQIKQ
ncbi:hypothetical protein [Adhaeribacter aquaticus]|uniref:hypothetical protein n=1 Tax=Adhaeribacter aquaticus TaxID=299567 RepID=UPI0004129DB9|nr:hypothetical protein [Adhaeribacter aquaticus]